MCCWPGVEECLDKTPTAYAISGRDTCEICRQEPIIDRYSLGSTSATASFGKSTAGVIGMVRRFKSLTPYFAASDVILDRWSNCKRPLLRSYLICIDKTKPGESNDMTPVDLGLTGKRASSRLINQSRASSDEEQMRISSTYTPRRISSCLPLISKTLRKILGSPVNCVNPMSYLGSFCRNSCRHSDHA